MSSLQGEKLFNPVPGSICKKTQYYNNNDNEERLLLLSYYLSALTAPVFVSDDDHITSPQRD
jgi:hypothetical protein